LAKAAAVSLPNHPTLPSGLIPLHLRAETLESVRLGTLSHDAQLALCFFTVFPAPLVEARMHASTNPPRCPSQAFDPTFAKPNARTV
jgi:hypothetical protein